MLLHDLAVRPEPPESESARAILRAYLDDVVSRFYGRCLTADELETAEREFANDDLVAPHGLLLVAWLHNRPVGCAGLRFGQAETGEVVRVFVDGRHRRRGVARALMTELESHARRRGLRRLRLDTRHDLIEARQLYASLGFLEVAPFNDEPYAEHWFEQILS